MKGMGYVKWKGLRSKGREVESGARHPTTCSWNPSEEQGSLAHIVSHRGFCSALAILPSPTPPHPSKPLQQFTHVMLASRIGLIHEYMCATASRVRVFINMSRNIYEIIRKAIECKMDGESPIVLYGHKDCFWDHCFWDLGGLPIYNLQVPQTV
jgi:hypothetical protein